MDELRGKSAIVTGASRGLGRAIAQRLAIAEMKVTGLARNKALLDELAKSHRGRILTTVGDITDPDLAETLLADTQPDLVILCGGVNGPIKTIDQLSWEEFSQTWNTDVRATLAWGQACLALPLPRGSEVIIISSGAAIGGSPISGGYAGAKRTQWLMADYFQGVSDTRDLNIRFRVILPNRIVGETGLGQAAATGYAARQGITTSQFLAGFGPPMDPSDFAEFVAQSLTHAEIADSRVIAITGDGPAVMEA